MRNKGSSTEKEKNDGRLPGASKPADDVAVSNRGFVRVPSEILKPQNTSSLLKANVIERGTNQDKTSKTPLDRPSDPRLRSKFTIPRKGYKPKTFDPLESVLRNMEVDQAKDQTSPSTIIQASQVMQKTDRAMSESSKRAQKPDTGSKIKSARKVERIRYITEETRKVQNFATIQTARHPMSGDLNQMPTVYKRNLASVPDAKKSSRLNREQKTQVKANGENFKHGYMQALQASPLRCSFAFGLGTALTRRISTEETGPQVASKGGSTWMTETVGKTLLVSDEIASPAQASSDENDFQDQSK